MSETMVHVQFVDAATGRVFAETDAPLSLLPQSFEAETQLEFSGQQWDVVAASPLTAELFAQSRSLVLTLRRARAAQIDPRAVLFSLPTICDAIPHLAPGTTKVDKHIFVFHEDDWRQIEFISRDHAAEMQEELRAIRHVYKAASIGPGFRAIHVRQRIATPLRLPWSAVLSAFPDARAYDGIAYRQAAGLIEGGFGLDVAGITLFGQQHDAIVYALCLAGAPTQGTEEAWNRRLKPWMAGHDLLLVDWCRCKACDAQALERFWTSK
ncbi:MAG TPA: hypothetical protein VFE42_05175 [Chloroflexota bacterium]|nr:hypothetical protein [Chloroflexota bacterium]